MGGQAFSKSGPDGTPLNVPRMPRPIYDLVSSQVQAQLLQLFSNVTIPREAPGKPDFGDIDFLVEGALTPDWVPLTIKNAIKAIHMIDDGGTKSFAIPYFCFGLQDEENDGAVDLYAQVDVQICPGEGTPDSKELFQWTRFMKSDSDLLQIIGICHRKLGLTCNDRGMHVRVPEIEPYNWKKSFVFLTRDPDAAMKFYGFGVEKYWVGFEDEEELFEWVSGGRFFRQEMWAEREEKADDRTRLKKRPLYRRFVDEFIPRHLEAGHPNIGERNEEWTREMVLEEALETFDKGEEYKAMIEEHELLEKDLEVWGKVRECLLEDLGLEVKKTKVVVRSLKRWVGFTDGEPFLLQEPVLSEPPTLDWGKEVKTENIKDVLVWVKENYQTAASLEKKRANKARLEGCQPANVMMVPNGVVVQPNVASA